LSGCDINEVLSVLSFVFDLLVCSCMNFILGKAGQMVNMLANPQALLIHIDFLALLCVTDAVK